MNTLLTIFIFWVLSKLFLGKAKDRFPNPTIPQRGEEVPTYKLPPELRGKWGPKDAEAERIPEAAEIILADPSAEPHKYTIARGSEIQNNSSKAAPSAPPVVSARQPQQSPCCCEGLLDGQELSPGMLRKGIILTEILGPPLARRRSGRTYQ